MEVKLSHYNVIKTQLKNKDSLIKALAKLGFGADKLKVHETAQQLEGYMGDKRKQTAEIVIPRKHVGRGANDIGFKKQEDGTYQAIISDYDGGKGHGRYGTKWRQQLNKHYNIEQSKKAFTANGWSYQEKVDQKGRVQLIGMGY